MSSQRELRRFIQRHPVALALTGLAFAVVGVAAIVGDPPRRNSEVLADYVVGPLGILLGVAALLLGLVRMARR